jgi:hypothetical protein
LTDTSVAHAMANEAREQTSAKQEEGKPVALYDLLKSREDPQSPDLQRKLVFQLLDTKVAQLDRATDRIKLLRNVLRIATLASSGLATVALGMKGGWLSAPVAQDFALVLTAAATFMGALAALWEVDNYWLRNKVMLNKLKGLRYRFAFTLAETSGTDRDTVKRIFDEIIGTLGDEYWETMLNRSFPTERTNGSSDVIGEAKAKNA